MKTQWIPSLRVKEALAICDSLSEPGKMPCHGYALPAQRCRLGSFLQQLPTAICHYCYALRGRYVFRKVRAAMERRIESLSDPRWVDAITTLIHRSGDRYFAGTIPATCKASIICGRSSRSARTCRELSFGCRPGNTRRWWPIVAWAVASHRIFAFVFPPISSTASSLSLMGCR